MKLQPIVYVSDMARSHRWYQQLLGAEPDVAGDSWTSFSVGGGHLALHLAPDRADNLHEGGANDPGASGGIELSLVTAEPLEQLTKRVQPHRGIADEAFGRSIILSDPDGSLIQVNEHDPDLYKP